MVFSHGQMEENMKENTSTTKSRVMECSHGLMEECTMDNGLMENNTERVYISLQRERKREENGMKERESDGSVQLNE